MIMGALVVFGVAVSLALQPELLRSPDGRGPARTSIILLTAAVAVGVASIVQGVVALADHVDRDKTGPKPPEPTREPPPPPPATSITGDVTKSVIITGSGSGIRV